MQHITNTISEYVTDFRNAASWALHYTLNGTGTALIATGTVLTGTGRALKVCGKKVKPAAKPRSRPAPVRRMRAVPQPTA
jgi:hypothetical protein